VAILTFVFIFVSQRFEETIIGNVGISEYGIGNQEMVVTRGYQPRITRHSFWLASIPDRVVLGLMSPFPWTEVFKSNNLFEWYWRSIKYAHTALMLVCFVAIAVFGFQDFKRKRLPPVSVVFSLMVALSGIVGYAIHSVYVQVGMLSVFPYVLGKLGKKRMINWYFASVLFFIISSVFWNYIR
jgi:hypothetical protein